MKRMILVSIGIILACTAMQRSPNIFKPIVVPSPTSRDVMEGRQAYQDYKNFKPGYTVLANELSSIVPGLFAYIPASLHKAIADYVPYAYPDSDSQELISELSKLMYSTFALRLFKWKALGYHFGLMPYYNFDQSYFYFEQPVPANENAILKGVRDDRSAKELLKLDDAIKKLSDSEDPKKDEFITQLKAERQGKAESLVSEYKIHLMPQHDPTITVVALLTLLKNDPELQNLIAAFKVMATDKLTINGVNYPRIVIYPAKGKENAQKALNKLYAGLKDIKGLGVRPRYNAKVNDLIWVAQGDSGYKRKSKYQTYFENPEFRYFRPDLTGKTENYHLVHPEIGKEIV